MRLFAALALVLATSAFAEDRYIIVSPGDRIIVSPAAAAGTPAPAPVPAPTPTPVPPPVASGFNGTCPGFDATRLIDMDWQAPQRRYTSAYGGFGPNDVVVVRFTTGSVASGASLPRLGAAEYNGSPYERIATLSDKPCDFGPQATAGARIEGKSITASFALGTGAYAWNYYPVLMNNSTYYLNMKNAPNSGCSGACDMFIDLTKSGGL